jgi:hypothetical protein
MLDFGRFMIFSAKVIKKVKSEEFVRKRFQFQKLQFKNQIVVVGFSFFP